VLGLARAIGVFGKGDVGGVEEEVAMMREKESKTSMAGWMLQLRMRSFDAFPHLVMTGYSIPKKQLTSLAIQDCSRHEAGKENRQARLESDALLSLCCSLAATRRRRTTSSR
jgi:hypothetical protein